MTLSLGCLPNAGLHFAFIDGVTLGGRPTPAAPGTWGSIKRLYR
jgi:hypothetical protein